MVKLVIRISDLKDSNLRTPKPKKKYKGNRKARKKAERTELRIKNAKKAAKKAVLEAKWAKMLHDKENGALAQERRALFLKNALNGSTKPAPAAKPILPDFPLAGHEKS